MQVAHLVRVRVRVRLGLAEGAVAVQVAHLAHWVGHVRGTCVVCVCVCAWHAHAWACGCMQVRGVQSMLRGACTAWSMVQVAHLAHGAWHVSGTCTACACECMAVCRCRPRTGTCTR